MEKAEDHYLIQHVVMNEQLPNAMQDGQIHDIQSSPDYQGNGSSNRSLHSTANQNCSGSCRGRSLKTQQGQATIKLAPNQVITS